MKNVNLTRILSVLLAVLLLCPVFSVIAFAETEAPAAETAAAEEAEGGIDISFDRLPANLGRMGVGMLCIIIVIGVLIGVTTVLNKVTAPKKK